MALWVLGLFKSLLRKCFSTILVSYDFIIVYSFDCLDFQPNAALTLIGATSVTAPSLDLAFLQYGAGASIYNPDIITNLFEND